MAAEKMIPAPPHDSQVWKVASELPEQGQEAILRGVTKITDGRVFIAAQGAALWQLQLLDLIGEDDALTPLGVDVMKELMRRETVWLSLDGPDDTPPTAWVQRHWTIVHNAGEVIVSQLAHCLKGTSK